MAGQSDANGSGVLIFSERADVGRELIAIGRQLADQAGTRLIALDLGQDAQDRADDAIARGVDQVLILRPTAAQPLDTGGLLEAVARGVQLRRPETVVIGATRIGVEVAARLAQRLGVACASECLTLERAASGDLIVERRIYGGRFIARQVLRSVPRVATVQLRRFEAPEPMEGRRGEIQELTIELPPPRVRTIAVKERARSQTDITRASIIVAAGRGVKKKEDLALLESLARTLGGELAASRPLTDDWQWLPMDRKVGLSGNTVKPNLYIGCGVSGQIEHIVGMRGARTVVAINSDPKAPIHNEADYSIIGDLYEVVPALIKACQEASVQPA